MARFVAAPLAALALCSLVSIGCAGMIAGSQGWFEGKKADIEPTASADLACNGKPIEGMRLLYTPNDNAQGDDRIVIEIVNSSGQNLKYTYDITVK